MIVAPQGSLEVWSYNDPAIERESIDAEKNESLQWAMREYIAHRDTAVLRLLPGMEPIRWQLRPMRMKAREWVEEVPGVRERHTRAFRACVEKVTGLETGEGPWQPATVGVEWLGTKFNVLDEKAIDFLEIAGWTAVINEIGGVAYQRAYLDPFGAGQFLPVLGSPVLSRTKSSAGSATRAAT